MRDVRVDLGAVGALLNADLAQLTLTGMHLRQADLNGARLSAGPICDSPTSGPPICPTQPSTTTRGSVDWISRAVIIGADLHEHPPTTMTGPDSTDPGLGGGQVDDDGEPVALPGHGMWRSSVAHLLWEQGVAVERSRVHTDSQGMIFQSPKTVAGTRTLALPDRLVDELRSHLDGYVGPGADDLVFTAERSGDTPTKVMWRSVWSRARSDSAVACTFHDLRHVAGTLNAAAGATVKEAMARLGHASPEAALRYQHAVASRDAEIAGSVDRLIQPQG